MFLRPGSDAQALEHLVAAVKKHGAECGVAYDGDADRIGVVDDKGEIIWGDKLMILLSRHVLKEQPGAAIVGEVKCSFTLYDDVAKHGGKPIMWKTGHSLIKAKMKEEHAALAGELVTTEVHDLVLRELLRRSAAADIDERHLLANRNDGAFDGLAPLDALRLERGFEHAAKILIGLGHGRLLAVGNASSCPSGCSPTQWPRAGRTAP